MSLERKIKRYWDACEKQERKRRAKRYVHIRKLLTTQVLKVMRENLNLAYFEGKPHQAFFRTSGGIVMHPQDQSLVGELKETLQVAFNYPEVYSGGTLMVTRVNADQLEWEFTLD